MTHRFATAALLTTALSSPAFADITAPDVWANQQAILAAFGGDLTGTVTDTGSGMTVTNMGARFDLPLGVGAITATYGDLTLTNQSDGTVDLRYPEQFGSIIEFEVFGSVVATIDFAIASQNHVVTVSGVPGSVTYDIRFDSYTAALANFSAPDFDTFFSIEELIFVVENGTSQYSIEESGDVITLNTTGFLSSFESRIVTVEGFSSLRTVDFTRTENIQSSSASVMPTQNVSLLNLAPAFRAGLSSYTEGTSGRYVSNTIATSGDGTVVSEQTVDLASTTTIARIDQNGLSFRYELGALSTTVTEPFLPPDMQFEASGGAFGLSVPLLQSAEPQPFALIMEAQDLTISDNLWALLDPNGSLDRGPIQMSLDSAGTMTWNVEILDLMNLESLLYAVDMPVALHALTINEGRLEALGATASLTGDMTFDMSDLFTIPGFPRPTGQAELQMDGVLGLLNELDQTGAFPPGELSGMTFALGFLLESIGDDSLRGVFEFTEDGQLLINGAPMPL